MQEREEITDFYRGIKELEHVGTLDELKSAPNVFIQNNREKNFFEYVAMPKVISNGQEVVTKGIINRGFYDQIEDTTQYISSAEGTVTITPEQIEQKRVYVIMPEEIKAIEQKRVGNTSRINERKTNIFF